MADEASRKAFIAEALGCRLEEILGPPEYASATEAFSPMATHKGPSDKVGAIADHQVTRVLLLSCGSAMLQR
jgi:hypothetical protein